MDRGLGLVNRTREPFPLRAVTFLDNLERRLSWLTFPGIIRTLALIQVAFFVLLSLRPESAAILAPNWDLVKQGELWRLVSFAFLPPVHPALGGGFSTFISVLFMFIVVNISFMVSDALEQAWSPFRVSLYIYGVIIFQSIAWHLPVTAEPISYYMAIFFAFATVYPNVKFLLFFIIPVKVWVLAAIPGTMLFLGSIVDPEFALVTLTGLFPYLIWAIPMFLRWRKNRVATTKRRASFEIHQVEHPTLHRCKVCDRTEKSDPRLDFRVARDGEEYCTDHLP